MTRALALRALLAVVLWGMSLAPRPASLAPVVEAAIPWMINYQGRLTDAVGGTSIAGSFTFTFRLYDAATGGTNLWQEQQTVALADSDSGIFNVVLGSVTSLSGVDFNSPVWLSVQVDSDSEMTPRQRLTATGYSMNADQVDGLDSTKFLRSDVDSSTSGKLTITRAGTALVITPSTNPSADTKLVDVQNAAGTSRFSVDIEGDTTVAGNLAVSGTISGSTSTSGTTNTTWTVDNDNTSGTEPASGAGLVIEGGSGDASLLWDATNDELDLNKDLNLTAQSDLRLADADSSNYVALQGPSTVSTNVTLTFPTTDGDASQVLQTDGSGGLTWATVDTSTSDDAPSSASYLTLGADSTLSAERVLTEGNYLDLTDAGANSTLTVAMDPTEVGSVTWGTTNATWTFDTSGTDPTIGWSSAAFDIDAAVTVDDLACETAGCLSATELGTDSVAADELTASGVTASTYGTSSAVPTIAVDADGRITSASNTTIVVTDAGSSTTSTTFTIDSDNTSGSEPASGAGLVIEGGTGDVSATWDATNNWLAVNNDVTIDTAAYSQSSAAGGLHIAVDPTAANSDGVIYLGRDSDETGGWGRLRFNSSNDKLTWNGAEFEVEGDSPSYMSFSASSDPTTRYSWKFNPDITPKALSFVQITSGTETELLRFSADGSIGAQDPTGTIRDVIAAGGKFKTQLKNLIGNGSFETPDPGGWELADASATAPSNTTTAKFGTYAVSVLDDSPTLAEGIKQRFPMFHEYKGQLMTVGVWARHSGASGTVTASLGFRDGVTAAASRYKDITLTTTYQQFTYTFTVDATATQLEVVLYGAGAGDATVANTNTNSVYYDGVTFAFGPFAMDFGPGVLTDTGDQTLYGDLTVAADTDPNMPGAVGTLAFGKPFGTGPTEFNPNAKTLKWIKDNERFEFNQNMLISGSTGAPPTGTAHKTLLQLGNALGTPDAGGAIIGSNPAGGFAGDFIEFEVGGTQKFRVDEHGNVTAAGTISGANGTGTGDITDVTEGNYIDVSSPGGPAPAVAMDPTEVGSVTWGAADSTWTFDATTGTNPTLAWTDNRLNLGGNVAVTGNIVLSTGGATVDGVNLDNVLNPTGTNDLTFGTGGAASFTHTYNVTGTDPTLNFGNGLITTNSSLTFSGDSTIRIGDSLGVTQLLAWDVTPFGQHAALTSDMNIYFSIDENNNDADTTVFDWRHNGLGANATLMVLAETGQLRLPITTGSTAGLLIGGDANLYRSAANTLATDDALNVLGVLSAGSSSNYSTFSTSGALTYVGTARPLRTMILTANGAITASGGAAQTLSGTNFKYYSVDFADGSTKDAYWQFVVPDSFDASTTTAAVTLYWMSSATSGDCRWSVAMDGKPVGTATVFDGALQTASANNFATNSTANALTTASHATVTTGWADGELAVVKVSRVGADAGDTLTATAKLVAVKIEYTASAESD